MAKFGNGRVTFSFKLTLFKLGCLCWSVWDVTFNDETFFWGSQKVYTNLDVDLSANISVTYIGRNSTGSTSHQKGGS